MLPIVCNARDVQCQGAEIGGEDVPLSDAVRETCRRDARHFETDGGTCRRIVEATVRRMEQAMQRLNWMDYRA